jgi:hypothetical protein
MSTGWSVLLKIGRDGGVLVAQAGLRVMFFGKPSVYVA